MVRSSEGAIPKTSEINNEADIEKITTKTAGILLETIQGGAGFIEPQNDFLKKVRELSESFLCLSVSHPTASLVFSLDCR